MSSLCLTALLATATPSTQAEPKDEDRPSSTVQLTLYRRDASGNAVAAPNVKVHVTRLSVDPVTQPPDGVVVFPLAPGSYTLTTVTGRRCSFDFKVPSGKAVSLALIVPSTGADCLEATKEALSATSASASNASAPARRKK